MVCVDQIEMSETDQLNKNNTYPGRNKAVQLFGFVQVLYLKVVKLNQSSFTLFKGSKVKSVFLYFM